MYRHNVGRDDSVFIDPQENFYTLITDRALCSRLQDELIDDVRFYEQTMALREKLSCV
jgi:hypothetical protein